MPETHAILSASAAHRWLHCTPCVRLEEQFPVTTSQNAEEGTLAHAIAELKLRKKFIEPMSQKTFTTRMNKLKKHELYQNEMQEHTDTYIDYLTECAMRFQNSPTVSAESKLDFSEWVPDGYGTADCVMVGDTVLQIADFKYGFKPVKAENNEQMRLYALGALRMFGMIYPIERVRMAIIQPRINSITESEMQVGELLQWANEVVKPAAALAYEGKGEYRAGDWCVFCRAKSQCRARAQDKQVLMDDFGNPQTHTPKEKGLLTDAEIGALLTQAEPFVKWLSDLQGYALKAVLEGKEIPGWKVVEGRSARTFSNQDAAFAALQAAGFKEALLYERKPLTLTAVEKLVGKAEFEKLCGAYVVRPQGKPNLVPESDVRKPYNSAEQDFEKLHIEKE